MKKILLFILMSCLFIQYSISAQEKNSDVLFPIFGYSEQTNLLLGAKYIKPSFINRNYDLDVVGVYSLENFYAFKGKIQSNSKYPYWFEFAYVNFPSVFFGKGNDTVVEKYDEYLEKYFRVSSGVKVGISKTIYMDFSLAHKNIDISVDNPSYYLVGNQTGKSGGVINVGSISIKHDKRADSGDIPSGYLNSVEYSISDVFFGSDYNFTKLNLDNRYFIRFGDDSVLATQLLLQAAKGDVPYYELPSLGGASSLRGFVSDRLRDKFSLHLGSEYRFPIFSLDEMTAQYIAFIDAGRVYGSVDEFSLRDLRVAYGGGVRFILSSSAIIRLDLGLSYEGSGMVLTFGNTF